MGPYNQGVHLETKYVPKKCFLIIHFSSYYYSYTQLFIDQLTYMNTRWGRPRGLQTLHRLNPKKNYTGHLTGDRSQVTSDT